MFKSNFSVSSELEDNRTTANRRFSNTFKFVRYSTTTFPAKVAIILLNRNGGHVQQSHKINSTYNLVALSGFHSYFCYNTTDFQDIEQSYTAVWARHFYILLHCMSYDYYAICPMHCVLLFLAAARTYTTFLIDDAVILVKRSYNSKLF